MLVYFIIPAGLDPQVLRPPDGDNNDILTVFSVNTLKPWVMTKVCRVRPVHISRVSSFALCDCSHEFSTMQVSVYIFPIVALVSSIPVFSIIVRSVLVA
jgi:hypothetical protein